jgi:CRP/FNR family transcriptional regulator, dissimilatory nitrate respiration regulator
VLTTEKGKVLSLSSLFLDWSPEELDKLTEEAGCSLCHYCRGEQICSPESYEKGLFFVLSGQVMVTKGEGNLLVSVLFPGDLFGAASLFNEEENYVAILTAQRETEILTFSEKSVQKLLDTREDFRRAYVRYLSGRIRFLSDKVDALIKGTGEKKLSAWLLQHMEEDGRVAVASSMTELASQLNIGRASLYRELQKLEERGILERKGRKIMILDANQLRND